MAEKIYSWIINVIVFLIALISLYPLIYIISASLMTQQEWMDTGGVFLFPHHPTIAAYRGILANKQLYQALGISVARSLSGSALHVFFSCLAGYAISRTDFVHRKGLLLFLVITMIYSGGLIPSFLIMDATGMIDNFLMYIIPGILGAYTALVFKQTFENTPKEIEEAALVDGVGQWRLLWLIMFPINIPTVMVLLLFSIVGQWNSWFDAYMYIIENDALIPLQLFLKNSFAINDGGIILVAPEAIKMATAVVGILPILLVYPFLQKYFTKGVYTGAVKG